MNLPKQIPFTLLMLGLLIVAGVYGQTHVGLLDPNIRDDFGFSTRLLFGGEFHRIFTSLLFTAGGWRFLSSLLMFAIAVGWVEHTRGTRQAVLTFLFIHITTLLLLSFCITWPLAAIETRHGMTMFDARDVGPSAGYYGCLGLAIAGMRSSRRTIIVTAILFVLLSRFVWSTVHLPEDGRMMLADLAHLVAFPIGLTVERLSPVFRSRGNRDTDERSSQHGGI